MKKKYSINKLINRILMGILVVSAFTVTQNITAQTVKHHVSVLNTTHQDFTWHYQITPTTHKIIEYFIVEATGGAIKVAFNACDVCYGNHLGYSQVGTDMKCNNCGNQYAIDNLGTAGTGGCWPGYLPHTVVGDSIVINHSDLIAGEYYFLLQTTSGIDDVSNNTLHFNLIKRQNELILNMSSNKKKEINVLNINGKQIYSASSSNLEVRISTNQFSAGVYIISVRENGKVNNQKIFID